MKFFEMQRNRWFMLPWLIKEAAIVMILFTISIIIFSVICFLIGEMIFKRMGVHSYPGAFLFAVYIPYSVVLLVVDGNKKNVKYDRNAVKY